ncbi:MAG: DUF421 domain-containing protein [Syntrophomonadaceae bacterium]|nr:DUF421 domain-containing protein [Syntrophomonadaceae bacterium]
MDWLWEATWKTSLAFFSVLIYARLLGKEQISQLTFYDYVTGITFGNLAGAIALAKREEVGHVFYELTLFVTIAFVISYITLKSRPLRKLIEGEPVIIIHNGKILENNMRKMRYNIENLFTQLRDKGFFDLNDIEFAIVETNGALSVLPKSQQRPITPADLQLPTPYEGLSSEIIVKGQVIYPNLAQNNLDEQWLIAELTRRGIKSPSEVFYANLNSNGTLYIDLWQDELENPIDITDSQSLLK